MAQGSARSPQEPTNVALYQVGASAIAPALESHFQGLGCLRPCRVKLTLGPGANALIATILSALHGGGHQN